MLERGEQADQIDVVADLLREKARGGSKAVDEFGFIIVARRAFGNCSEGMILNS
ncbi:hypothetical protein IVA81_19915 [Bradyrhizobium sp. 141]|nr:hypothetical protein [Bradyrhizobium sp. 141]